MNRLFDPQNLLFQALSWMVDLVGISLFWAILCLPVVTIVPATAALYHTAALCLRLEEASNALQCASLEAMFLATADFCRDLSRRF